MTDTERLLNYLLEDEGGLWNSIKGFFSGDKKRGGAGPDEMAAGAGGSGGDQGNPAYLPGGTQRPSTGGGAPEGDQTAANATATSQAANRSQSPTGALP